MHKTLRIGALLVAVLGMTFLACDKMGAPQAMPDDPGRVEASSNPYTTPLIAGQNYVAGNVTVYYTPEYVYVEYNLTGNWYLTDYQFHVTNDCERGFPLNKNGNPQIGQFDYQTSIPGGTQHVLVPVPWKPEWTGEDELCFATHAVVEDRTGTPPYEQQTGWGKGEPFPGGSWAMKFCVEVPKMLSLPTSRVTVRYIGTSGQTPHWFRLSNVPSGYTVVNGDYRAFCLDNGVYIYNQEYQARLWACYDPNLPDYAKYNRGTSTLTPYAKIAFLGDYFMDNYVYSGHPTAAEIYAFQYVFWYYRGKVTEPASGTLARTLLDHAEANWADWTPGTGDWIPVLMDIDRNIQLNFILVDP